MRASQILSKNWRYLRKKLRKQITTYYNQHFFVYLWGDNFRQFTLFHVPHLKPILDFLCFYLWNQLRTIYNFSSNTRIQKWNFNLTANIINLVSSFIFCVISKKWDICSLPTPMLNTSLHYMTIWCSCKFIHNLISWIF